MLWSRLSENAPMLQSKTNLNQPKNLASYFLKVSTVESCGYMCCFPKKISVKAFSLLIWTGWLENIICNKSKEDKKKNPLSFWNNTLPENESTALASPCGGKDGMEHPYWKVLTQSNHEPTIKSRRRTESPGSQIWRFPWQQRFQTLISNKKVFSCTYVHPVYQKHKLRSHSDHIFTVKPHMTKLIGYLVAQEVDVCPDLRRNL